MASTIRYIGNYDVAAEGKILWEILCQLKGLGVGRYVTKTDWDLRWPDQPSYLKIVKVNFNVQFKFIFKLFRHVRKWIDGFIQAKFGVNGLFGDKIWAFMSLVQI